ncbi:MAG: substrate-binding domain-containing protein [Firmicutes bacterium]|nr:substrate-binding domain-containing protein [Bacillota bacterium]
MKSIKTAIALVLTVVLAMALVACGSKAPAETTAAPNATVKVGFTAMNLTDPFQIAVRDTVKARCEEMGWEFQSGDGNGDNAKQINLCEDMINGGINYLVLCPVSQDGILPILELCKQKGVTVINYDSACADQDLVACYIASDNYSAGKLDAEFLNEKYPEGGELMIINNPRAESVVARVKGLTENLNSNFVVVEDAAITTSKDVLAKVDDALIAHPNLKFIFGLNDTCGMMARGCAEAAGRNDIVVVSVDGSPDCQASIKDGGMMATAAQSPITLGEESFKAIKTLVEGGSVEDVSVPCFIISQDNIDQFDITQWH